MSRAKIAIWGVGPVAAVPLTIMTLREFVTTLLYDTGSGRSSDLAIIGCACGALFLLNAALLASSPSAGLARLLIAHAILAPFAAWCCFFGAVDPVALFIALPLVAGIVMTLGTSACPLRRFAGSR